MKMQKSMLAMYSRRITSVVLLLIGLTLIGLTAVTAWAEDCGWAWNPKAGISGAYEWHWCIPNLPPSTFRAPSWPDPRPVLVADKNSAPCKDSIIMTYNNGFYAAAWRYVPERSYQVRKPMWPDYYHRVYEWVYTYKLTTGFWSGWQLPPVEKQLGRFWDCDV